MKIHSQLRQSRLARGLSEQQTAASLGISVSSYCDLESYEDEWLDIPLEKIRALSRALQLDVLQLIESNGSLDHGARSAAPLTIADAFRASGKSVAELSDDLGVKEAAINQVLSDERSLEQWPMSFVLSLCAKLGIPLRVILTE